MKAVIIAAGQSSRLWTKSKRTPKTLLPFRNGTILSSIVDNLRQCGVESLVIVVGWKKRRIVSYVREQNFDMDVEFIINTEWKRGNGLSVLAAQEAVGNNPFILSMCDHIVSPAAIRRVMNDPREMNLLLVDQRVEEIYDIEDATKVRFAGENILDIGKELTDYNGIDCGIFRLDAHFFTSMEKQIEKGGESISAAVKGLIAANRMGAVFMNNDESWIDIDTPAAYYFAVRHFAS